MQILLIEDDQDKRERILQLVHEFAPSTLDIEEAESLRSGLKRILDNPNFDLLLLDMSMPSFDITSDEPEGGTPESFAGRDLMEQMKMRSISIPTLVITQYRTFDGGSVTLEELDEEFRRKFSNFYQGAIYYNSAIESWRKELASYLNRFFELGK